MFTDYKTSYRTQHVDGSWTVLIRVYEGDITTEDEPDTEDGMVPVERYRRTSVLWELVQEFPAMTEGDMVELLNRKLATDTTRTPILEQVVHD